MSGDHRLRIVRLSQSPYERYCYLGAVLILVRRCLSISPVLPGFQGGCKVTAERMMIKEANIKSLLLLLVAL
jgi:hypothetical protein